MYVPTGGGGGADDIRYNLYQLSDKEISKKFSVEVRNRFQILEVRQTTEIGAKTSAEEKWSHVKEAYHSTSKNILGIKKRQHKEWISLETLGYIKQRKTLKNKISQNKSEHQRDTGSPDNYVEKNAVKTFLLKISKEGF